jgi:hypothetical protein
MIEAAYFSQTLVQPSRLHDAINQVTIVWIPLINRADNSGTKIFENYNSGTVLPYVLSCQTHPVNV